MRDRIRSMSHTYQLTDIMEKPRQAERILQSVKKLLPTPQILPKLKALLSDANTSIDDILSLVKVDLHLESHPKS